MNTDKQPVDVKAMLRSKITEKKLNRSSKKVKEHTLDKTLKELGIDKEKFKQDLETVQSRGKVVVKS